MFLFISLLKGYVHYTFTSLFSMSKREHLRNKRNIFYFSSKAFFVLDNQILTFQKFKCYDVIKCLNMKHIIE